MEGLGRILRDEVDPALIAYLPNDLRIGSSEAGRVQL
jgi:hypothetical protein